MGPAVAQGRWPRPAGWDGLLPSAGKLLLHATGFTCLAAGAPLAIAEDPLYQVYCEKVCCKIKQSHREESEYYFANGGVKDREILFLWERVLRVCE